MLDNDLFGLQTLQYMMKVTRTWDACMSMLPKGGKAIWGDATWSPEEGYDCSQQKEREVSEVDKQEKEASGLEIGAHGKPIAHFGRMVAFGKDTASLAYDVILDRRKEVKVVQTSTFCGVVLYCITAMRSSEVQQFPLFCSLHEHLWQCNSFRLSVLAHLCTLNHVHFVIMVFLLT